jgi:hypothetical protein
VGDRENCLYFRQRTAGGVERGQPFGTGRHASRRDLGRDRIRGLAQLRAEDSLLMSRELAAGRVAMP